MFNVRKMISQLDRGGGWAWRRVKILSLGWTLLIVLLAFLTTEVGSYNTASYGDGSNRNGVSSLCRVIRASRKSLLTSFRDQYTASNFFCDISDHCANVTCAAEFSRGRVNAGLLLKLCEPDPELDYWVDLPGQWDEPWVHTFSSRDTNGQVQRVEIGKHNGTSSPARPTKWFIKVTYSITPGRIQANRATKHLSLQSVLQICQSDAEDSCRNTTLLDFPRLPQDQLCYFDDEASPLSDSFGGNPPASSSRSSRNANAWNPEEVHSGAHERARKLESGRPWPEPGDKCDIENILSCGNGLTCVHSGDGSGLCHCMADSVFINSTSGCVKMPSSPAPLGPSISPDSDSDSRSYSSAIGAILAIFILVTIALGIFFGTKYHYWERIRHRMPVFRCWPFRRNHQSGLWADDLTMDRF